MVTTTKIEIEPTPAQRHQAHDLGLRMAKEDGWIRPACNEGDDYTDFGQFVGAHRGEWESSNQFIMLWHERLDKIVDAAADRLKELLDRDLTWEERYHGLYEELLNELWEAWETQAKLYEVWCSAREEHANAGRR